MAMDRRSSGFQINPYYLFYVLVKKNPKLLQVSICGSHSDGWVN